MKENFFKFFVCPNFLFAILSLQQFKLRHISQVLFFTFFFVNLSLSCTEDLQCNDDEKCLDGVCKKFSKWGEACSHDSDCARTDLLFPCTKNVHYYHPGKLDFDDETTKICLYSQGIFVNWYTSLDTPLTWSTVGPDWNQLFFTKDHKVAVQGLYRSGGWGKGQELWNLEFAWADEIYPGMINIDSTQPRVRWSDTRWKCPDNYVLEAFFKDYNNNNLDDISFLMCIRPKVGGSETLLSFKDCYYEDVYASFDNAGWSSCKPGYFISEMLGGSCTSLYCIESFRCCRYFEHREYIHYTRDDWRAVRSFCNTNTVCKSYHLSKFCENDILQKNINNDALKYVQNVMNNAEIIKDNICEAERKIDSQIRERCSEFFFEFYKYTSEIYKPFIALNADLECHNLLSGRVFNNIKNNLLVFDFNDGSISNIIDSELNYLIENTFYHCFNGICELEENNYYNCIMGYRTAEELCQKQHEEEYIRLACIDSCSIYYSDNYSIGINTNYCMSNAFQHFKNNEYSDAAVDEYISKDYCKPN